MRGYRIWIFALALTCVHVSTSVGAEERRSHIPRAQLEQMFSQIRANTPWILDGPLIWGYFFTATDKQALENASALLVQKGYHFVEIHLQEKKSRQNRDVWWLHVEKVERHTIDSLDERNAELDDFAKEQHLTSYDGMDVGPAF